jgi:hypothetical protein
LRCRWCRSAPMELCGVRSTWRISRGPLRGKNLELARRGSRRAPMRLPETPLQPQRDQGAFIGALREARP